MTHLLGFAIPDKTDEGGDKNWMERQAFAPIWSPDGERLVVTTTPPGAPTPRLAEPAGLSEATLLVIDREGRELFEAPGMMPDWMPAWR